MEKYKQLLEAKENVKYLLDNPDSLIDMHGLAYWAKVVETLRQEVKV
jgi:Fe-S cluster assembly ATPase SufC